MSTVTPKERVSLINLNFVLCASLMSEYMDELKGTVVYKSKTKILINELSNDMNKRLRADLPKVFAKDEEIVVNMLREMQNVIELISTLTGDDLIAVSQIIKSFADNKDEFLDRNPIILKTLNA